MFEWMKLGFAEAQWLVITALAIYAWVIRKYSASAKEMLDLHVRVVALENAIKDMPSKVEMARIEGQIESMKHQLNSANSSIAQVQRGVARIEQYFIDNQK